MKNNGAWRSLVAYSLGVRVVGRSNRLAPTIFESPYRNNGMGFCFVCRRHSCGRLTSNFLSRSRNPVSAMHVIAVTGCGCFIRFVLTVIRIFATVLLRSNS